MEVQSQSSPSIQPEGSSVQEKWKACLEKIKSQLPLQSFRTWFLPIIPVSFTEDTLILRVPSRFFFEWVDSHYGEMIRGVVREVFGFRAAVEYLIASTKPRPVELEDVLDEVQTQPPVQSQPAAEGRNTWLMDGEELDEAFHFENFFTGGDNELALRAAEYVAGHTSKVKYNPLFIYGDIGTGKTHLLHAIGNRVRERRSNARILFLSAEKFMNEYVAALQNGEITRFKHNLASLDVFILDDLQNLAHKNKSQEVLLYILNELVRKKRQVILSASLPPAKMTEFNKQLLSFIQKGLMVDLLPASVFTRRKFVQYFLQEHDVELSQEAIEFLITALNANMHLLHATMVRVVAQVSLLGRPLEMERLKAIVAQMFPNWNGSRDVLYPRPEALSIEKIINEVALYFNIPADVLQGHSRKREIQMARQVAMYLVRQLTNEPLTRIGYHFGNRTHAAVLYACQKIEEGLEKNPLLKDSVLQLKDQILNHQS